MPLVLQICKRGDRAALFRHPAGIILDVLGQLLLCLVLWHRCRSECLFLLLANPPTARLGHPEMKEPEPYFAQAATFDLLDPALGCIRPRQSAAEAFDVEVDGFAKGTRTICAEPL